MACAEEVNLFGSVPKQCFVRTIGSVNWSFIWQSLEQLKVFSGNHFTRHARDPAFLEMNHQFTADRCGGPPVFGVSVLCFGDC